MKLARREREEMRSWPASASPAPDGQPETSSKSMRSRKWQSIRSSVQPRATTIGAPNSVLQAGARMLPKVACQGFPDLGGSRDSEVRKGKKPCAGHVLERGRGASSNAPPLVAEAPFFPQQTRLVRLQMGQGARQRRIHPGPYRYR